MPQVGKKKFAYTKAGKKKAKVYAKKYSKKVKKGQIMNRIFPTSGPNVNGNWKADAMKKAKQHIKTGKKFINKKAIPSAVGTYKSYVKPTVGMFKTATNIATGVGKLALRNPLLATGAFLASKATAGSAKKFPRPKFKEWNKKGKWMV